MLTYSLITFAEPISPSCVDPFSRQAWSTIERAIEVGRAIVSGGHKVTTLPPPSLKLEAGLQADGTSPRRGGADGASPGCRCSAPRSTHAADLAAERGSGSSTRRHADRLPPISVAAQTKGRAVELRLIAASCRRRARRRSGRVWRATGAGTSAHLRPACRASPGRDAARPRLPCGRQIAVALGLVHGRSPRPRRSSMACATGMMSATPSIT